MDLIVRSILTRYIQHQVAAGYALGSAKVMVVASRDKIDEEARFEAGSQVTQIRVGLSLLIDTFIGGHPL